MVDNVHLLIACNSRSPRLQTLFYVPFITPHFSVQTWATMLFLTSQMSGIIRFFLSKNLRIAKVGRVKFKLMEYFDLHVLIGLNLFLLMQS
jgi:hypothetical protein